MDDTYRDRTSLVKGAKEIAREAKRQAVKKVNKAVDRAQDEYTHRSYSRFQDEEEEEEDNHNYKQGGQYGEPANDDEGSSDATEGHDEEDEIYEGEYQGIPNTGQAKDNQVDLGQAVMGKDRRELESERQADEEELAQQYELIIQECGHGRFQWQLFFVLGMALMADGVEVFVVGFVLPSAETDMCVPNSGAGWLAEGVKSEKTPHCRAQHPRPVVSLIDKGPVMMQDSRIFLCVLRVLCRDLFLKDRAAFSSKLNSDNVFEVVMLAIIAGDSAGSIALALVFPQVREANSTGTVSPHSSIVYLGMMVGAFFWGGMADKVGRRQTLLICMSVNGFFAFLSSFVQGYGLFLLCRVFSGFGIGGAVPVVFSYFAEVLAREKRGEHLSWLCMFWMIGGIYASAMAWAIIPHYAGWLLTGHTHTHTPGWSFSMGSAYQFHSWRVFVVVCAFPCVCSVVSLTFMPESPRYFLEVGKHDEAWMILKQIHDTNMRARGQPEKVFTVNRIKTPKQINELIEMQAETGNWFSRGFAQIRSELYGIWLTFMRCFHYPVKDNTIKLAIVWFTLSFGYYGLSVWFPDVINHLQSDEYASRVKTFSKERLANFTFNFTLENQIHSDGEYINNRFIGMKFKSVTYIDFTFKNCYFDDVTSLSTYFRNCTFLETFFYNTDIEESKFINTEVINSTFHHNKTGCQMTFDDDYSAYWVYFVNFLGTLAVLPGNIVSALLMDKIGRLTMLGMVPS
ncbi:SV2C protein, partial [Polyodon spathula]|nr:SV2C protein [Polyodon spathula]